MVLNIWRNLCGNWLCLICWNDRSVHRISGCEIHVLNTSSGKISPWLGVHSRRPETFKCIAGKWSSEIDRFWNDCEIIRKIYRIVLILVYWLPATRNIPDIQLWFFIRCLEYRHTNVQVVYRKTSLFSWELRTKTSRDEGTIYTIRWNVKVC